MVMAQQSTAIRVPPGSEDPPSAKILIVDDTPANLLAFDALLQPLGHEIVQASSGAAALERAAGQEFAVVLLDVVMPGMDGFETLTRLRDDALIRSTPVILVTGRDLDLAEIQRAYALGAIDYVVKPVHAEILRGKVTSCASLYLANQELRRRQAALEMKDRQIAVLAHDLRNPLSTVAAAAALLKLRPDADPEKQSLLVDRITRSAKRMDGMIHDLLDYARAGTGAIPLLRERMDLGDLCRELIEEFELADPDRRIELTVSGDVTGEWDRARLYQALSNLAGNATRYGHGKATIAVSRRADHVDVSVFNAGPPIAPELLPTIFEPFKRGVAHGAGLGLGLYIARAIAHAHGGDVTLESSQQAGTTFVLRLAVR
jgi:signal transduction histidine kinase